jgi:hypothetical protein
VRVVKDSEFTSWVDDAKKKFAGVESVPPNSFAAATPVMATLPPR